MDISHACLIEKNMYKMSATSKEKKRELIQDTNLKREKRGMGDNITTCVQPKTGCRNT